MASLDWLSILVSAAITTPAVGGLLGFLGKKWLVDQTAKHNQALEALKAGYNAELEAYKSDLERSKQLLQGEIEKTILVTRVHFETEFSALKQVFARLVEVRLRIVDLRPSVSIVPANDTAENRRKRLSEAVAGVAESYNLLATESENLSPFYPSNIYAEIAKCRQATSSEIDDIALTTDTEAFTTQWFARGRENVKQFLEAYTSVSQLIRERISKLAVVRGF